MRASDSVGPLLVAAGVALLVATAVAESVKYKVVLIAGWAMIMAGVVVYVVRLKRKTRY